MDIFSYSTRNSSGAASMNIGLKPEDQGTRPATIEMAIKNFLKFIFCNFIQIDQYLYHGMGMEMVPKFTIKLLILINQNIRLIEFEFNVALISQTLK